MSQNKVRSPQWQLCTSFKSFLKKISWMLGLNQSPIYFALINLTNPIILELWKIHSCLLKIKKIGKKIGFLVTLNPKKWREKNDLKLFENHSDIKIIWKTWVLKIEVLKIKVSKIIWKLKFWKLEFQKLFENWIFEN